MNAVLSTTDIASDDIVADTNDTQTTTDTLKATD